MRLLFPLFALALLSGCAANEYSAAPEATGEWVPANPSSLTMQAPPPGLARRPVRLYSAASGAAR